MGDQPPQVPAHWPRVKDLFAQALELPPEGRASWLESAGADAATVREVRALLDAHEDIGQFLESAALEEAANAQAVVSLLTTDAILPAGLLLGPYRIIRPLGEGGMGRVYLAERADEAFHKLVAIKVVRVGPSTHDLMARFPRERQILAELDHPNVARLIDAGSTNDGLPYFVMEYVDGLPIDRFCAERDASVAERLDLFSTVCAVVAHAHRRQVIHRDLKASNILVSRQGVPKLLDFGIAKIVGPRAPVTGHTNPDWRVLTPESASPEQLRGGAITPATDVYALGVLLYRLLVGDGPYAFTRDMTPAALERAICDEMPVPPSRCAPAARRHDLTRDMDRIVMKALAKEPERRYASVEDLDDDLRRLRAGQPVLAGDPSVTYRLFKFVRRHRLALAAATTVAIAVWAGVVMTMRTSMIANRRLDTVRQLTTTLLVDLPEAMKNQPGATENQRQLVMRTLTSLTALANATGQRDPEVARELVTAYLKAGDVLGNPYLPNLGAATDALDAYAKGVALAEELTASRAHEAADWTKLAQGEMSVGDLVWARGDNQAALTHYRRAQDIADARGSAIPTELRGRIIYGFGQALLRAGRANEATPYFAKAADVYGECLVQPVVPQQCRIGAASAQAKLGDVARANHDVEAALVHSQRAVAVAQQTLALEPSDRRMRRLAAFLTLRLAEDLATAGRGAEGAAVATTAGETFTELNQSDPSDAQARDDMGYQARILGDALLSVGDTSGAATAFRRTVEAFGHYLESGQPLVDHVAESALARKGLADVARLRESSREELEELEAAAGLFDALGESGLMSDRALVYERLGLILLDEAASGRADASALAIRARESLEKALATWTALNAQGLVPPDMSGYHARIEAALARVRNAK